MNLCVLYIHYFHVNEGSRIHQITLTCNILADAMSKARKFFNLGAAIKFHVGEVKKSRQYYLGGHRWRQVQ